MSDGQEPKKQKSCDNSRPDEEWFAGAVSI